MKGWVRYAIITVLIVMGCAGGLAVVAHLLLSAPNRVEVARRGLEQALGATVGITGPIDVAILPRPHLEARDVRISAADGAVAIHVGTVRASLAWLPLLEGRLAFNRVQFASPTGVVDLDALTFSRGRRLATTDPIAPDLVPNRITLTSAVLRIRSHNAATDGTITDLHAEIGGLGGVGITIAGGAGWHGVRGDFSAHFDSAAAFFVGSNTTGAVKLRSPLATIAMNGIFARGWQGGFTGKAAFSSPAFSALMRTAGIRAGSDLGIQHASLSGDAETTDAGVALSNAKLILNDTALEGTLAWQGSEGRPGLVGTLATDTLALDALVSALPPLRDPGGPWSTASLDAALLNAYDVDLRISANRVTLKSVETEDAALSVLCQAGRLEISLGEARAYGGLVKGRVFVNDIGDDVEVKLDATWSRLDLNKMTAVFGTSDGQLAGSSSGHLTAGGRGASMGAIVNSTAGRGQVSLRQAKLAGIDVVEALVHPDQHGIAADAPDDIAVDLASADFKAVNGVLTIGTASVAGPDLHLGIQGQTSLSAQNYRLSSTPIDTGTAPGSATTVLVGQWGGPVHRLEPAIRATTATKDRESASEAFYP